MYCWWAPNSLAICSLRASAKGFSGIEPPGLVTAQANHAAVRRTARLAIHPLAPAKPSGRGRRIEGAGGHAVRHARVVVAGWGDVVGGVGVEQRGQILDLAASRPDLSLAAAVDRDSRALAVLVHAEQLAQGAEARRLRVDRPRLALQRLDVGQRVKRRIPGDSVGMRLEHWAGLVVQVGVL